MVGDKPMNIKKTSTFLLLASSIFSLAATAYWNQSITIEKDISSTIQSIENSNEQWFSYQFKAEENNGSPCCYQKGGDATCYLDDKNKGWGVTHHAKSDSEFINIYFKMSDSRPSRILLSGDSCHVDKQGKTVYQLNDVKQQQSVKFLSSFVKDNANQSKKVNAQLLSAIALHQSDLAQNKLEKWAASDNRRLSHDAIFWLGSARNQAGYSALVKIIDDKKRGLKTRRHAVFALSENKYAQSEDKLAQLAKSYTEPKVQAEAIFWLADSNSQQALPVIKNVLSSSNNSSVKRKAIFALSEIDSEESWKVLVEAAEGNKSKRLREEAIFWLSQTKHFNAEPVLMNIIQQSGDKSVQKKAVFALSQLSQPRATESLIKLMKDGKNKTIKKQALFWLGESDDPGAIAAIESVLFSTGD